MGAYSPIVTMFRTSPYLLPALLLLAAVVIGALLMPRGHRNYQTASATGCFWAVVIAGLAGYSLTLIARIYRVW